MTRDIGEWLEGLRLGQYKQVFADNDIDRDLLLELSEDDLEKLGIASLGHRKRLLRSIAALRREAQSENLLAESKIRPRSPSATAGAERRQITVMFCDMVGSTELSGRLDPEDLREVMRAYHEACARVVARFDGHIAKYLGDGILVSFGFPRAHEDDAERAVRAGLDIVEVMGTLDSGAGVSMAARVGIATGLVVVGDLVGEGISEEAAITGETPNLAARLQTLAEPNSVVIASSTRKLAGESFEYADLGAQTVKGFPEPQQVWRVIGPRHVESRFEAAHAAGLTPLVGRENEIALLLDRWRRANDGQGQVVLLSGEAGIGKSRIAQELRSRLAAERHVRFRYQCSPYYSSSALYPVIAQLERAARFHRDDTAKAKLDKLEATLAPAASTDAAPLLAALLSIPHEGRYPALNLSPQRQKEMTFEALIEQVALFAASRPALVIVEDAHWIDPTMLELLQILVVRVQALAALLVITHRPPFEASWSRYSHVTSLTLHRLAPSHGALIVGQLTGGRSLPEEVLNQILAKTDGVPLFVEELTKSILESGLLKPKRSRYALAGRLPPLAIPATLKDSLMARIDRLAPVKEVAQLAAAIGREFSFDLMEAASPMPAHELRNALDQLVDSELAFRRGSQTKESYSFKHALVRDAAYEGMLRADRRLLHGRIAAALEDRFPEQVEAKPELVALHFAGAGLADRAAGYWLKAGQLALRRSAAAEAILHLTAGLDQIMEVSDPIASTRLELGLQATLGVAQSHVKGYGASDVRRAYHRAHELCRKIGDTPETFPVLVGLASFHLVRGNVDLAQEFGEQIRAIAEQQRDDDLLLISHCFLGVLIYLKGELESSLEHLSVAQSIYSPERHSALLFEYGIDFGIFTTGYHSFAKWASGYPDQARDMVTGMVDLCQQLDLPFSLCVALTFAAVMMAYRRQADRVVQWSSEGIDQSREQGFPQWQALCLMLGGWGLAQTGDADVGIKQLRSGISQWRAVGANMFQGFNYTLMAEAQVAAGRADDAVNSCNTALRWIERTQERIFGPLAYHARGNAWLALRRPDRAGSDFETAIDIARQQGARMPELRAATSLARLLRDEGKTAQARDMLAPLYDWFTEGFDTGDLKETDALLRELS